MHLTLLVHSSVLGIGRGDPFVPGSARGGQAVCVLLGGRSGSTMRISRLSVLSGDIKKYM